MRQAVPVAPETGVRCGGREPRVGVVGLVGVAPHATGSTMPRSNETSPRRGSRTRAADRPSTRRERHPSCVGVASMPRATVRHRRAPQRRARPRSRGPRGPPRRASPWSRCLAHRGLPGRTASSWIDDVGCSLGSRGLRACASSASSSPMPGDDPGLVVDAGHNGLHARWSRCSAIAAAACRRRRRSGSDGGGGDSPGATQGHDPGAVHLDVVGHASTIVCARGTSSRIAVAEHSSSRSSKPLAIVTPRRRTLRASNRLVARRGSDVEDASGAGVSGAAPNAYARPSPG